MIFLLTALMLAGPSHAEDAKADADRAPDASLFLPDDPAPQARWSVSEGDSGMGFDPADFDVEDELGDDSPGLGDAKAMDPIEGIDGPDISRMEPLGDHFELSVSPTKLGTTAVELPLLVARGPEDLEGDLWVVADFYIDGRKCAESRHFVMHRSVSETGPTYAWLKTSLPDVGPAGVAEVRVFAALPGKKEELLFVRQAAFAN